jgi:hypothetical protein
MSGIHITGLCCQTSMNITDGDLRQCEAAVYDIVDLKALCQY